MSISGPSGWTVALHFASILVKGNTAIITIAILNNNVSCIKIFRDKFCYVGQQLAPCIGKVGND